MPAEVTHHISKLLIFIFLFCVQHSREERKYKFNAPCEELCVSMWLWFKPFVEIVTQFRHVNTTSIINYRWKDFRTPELLEFYNERRKQQHIQRLYHSQENTEPFLEHTKILTIEWLAAPAYFTIIKHTLLILGPIGKNRIEEQYVTVYLHRETTRKTLYQKEQKKRSVCFVLSF